MSSLVYLFEEELHALSGLINLFLPLQSGFIFIQGKRKSSPRKSEFYC